MSDAVTHGSADYLTAGMVVDEPVLVAERDLRHEPENAAQSEPAADPLDVDGRPPNNADGAVAVGRQGSRSRLIPSLRDTVFRRLLVIADLLAAAAGLGLLGLLMGRGCPPSAWPPCR